MIQERRICTCWRDRSTCRVDHRTDVVEDQSTFSRPEVRQEDYPLDLEREGISALIMMTLDTDRLQQVLHERLCKGEIAKYIVPTYSVISSSEQQTIEHTIHHSKEGPETFNPQPIDLHHLTGLSIAQPCIVIVPFHVLGARALLATGQGANTLETVSSLDSELGTNIELIQKSTILTMLGSLPARHMIGEMLVLQADTLNTVLNAADEALNMILDTTIEASANPHCSIYPITQAKSMHRADTLIERPSLADKDHRKIVDSMRGTTGA